MPRSDNSITILVVDDDESVRRLLRSILADHGYHVLEAQDGVEALEVAAKYGERIHLLLTDVIMPRLNGLVLAERLLQERHGMAVVLMSGYVEATLLSAKFPESLFLQKPFRADHLLDAVRAALGSVRD